MSYYGHGGGDDASKAPHHNSFHKPAVNASSQIDAAKIFVGGLSWQTTEETLRYHFEQYGEVVSVEVMRDRQTGDPRGFAFVVFKSDETVDLILKSCPHEINQKVVDVKRAQARGVAPPSIHHGGEEESVASGGQQHHSAKQERHHNSSAGLSPEQLRNKIFVGGLPLHCDKDGLKDFFSVFGPVVDAIVMMDTVNQRSRGFGFVTFENGSGGAQSAIEVQPINMFGKMVEVKLATPKGERDGGGGGGNFQQKHYQKQVMAPSASNTGEFAGLASAYGRAGWRAGYGSKAFGKAGWSVVGWDDGGDAPDKTGFSFAMLDSKRDSGEHRESKRRRQ
eukprot:CAMPEP_0201693196 /NCGR_PEP_ID=MMETSP0578-20130828/5856_1 /ASSEMBLY_ACC=CAM_ASM_000663 /TAXON_ID=267565 /ORGANISM="Skeletonema grethea, Strain CCMP 1804" /LENGTH=334 /DNA_ID=CAMNT_0048178681 /DNA_START=75 /DNA_END=1079 /DNA_ORIENTATION=-